jgi:hypothetical protein
MLPRLRKIPTSASFSTPATTSTCNDTLLAFECLSPIVAELTFTPFLHRKAVEPMFNLCSGTPSQSQEHENSEEKTQLGNSQSFFKDDLLLRTNSTNSNEEDGRKDYLFRQVFNPRAEVMVLHL